MRAAFEQDQMSRRPSEASREAALEAWTHHLGTGLHVTRAEADAWLAELEAGNDVEPPRAHR